MSRTQVTLRGGDTEQFEEIRSEIADARGGNEPSNAETLRMLMQAWSSRRVPV
ncbi:hypothetical protein [Haloparvum sedimenti]|uniref:hypothetical protein n=1 Tax=Haloparvum sedimenti TaxID=1678448 RepID=UPI00159ECE24|nr:hypothetical protein [Haloparvum sedimenti]